MSRKAKLIILSSLLLFTAISLNATVSKATVDSIEHVLNSNIQGCDQSCSYFAGEHTSIGIGNSLLTFILIALGTVWLFVTYKKKYLIVIGSLLGLAVIGTYLYPQIQNSQNTPANCPVVQNKSGTLTDTISNDVFIAPTSDEFGSPDTASVKNVAKTDSTTASNDEFAPVSGDEFSSGGEEFASAGDEFSTAKSLPAPERKIDYKQVLEPIIIFLIIAMISLMIKYPWFRKTRGFFLLAGLLYLGFYRGACPCMISSFQNTVLGILGVSIRLESLLWFLLLIPGAYLFGRIWCGWLCHLGALQEFMFSASKFKILTSRKAQSVFKMILITVFILWILQLIITKTNIFCEYDPFKVAFNLISASTTGYILLAILLLSSVLIYRPFCRTICPVGLILGLTSYIPGARKLEKKDSCINCKSCDKECKQRAMIHEGKTTTLKEEDCIMCGECISKCKIKALNVKWTKQKGTKN